MLRLHIDFTTWVDSVCTAVLYFNDFAETLDVEEQNQSELPKHLFFYAGFYCTWLS